MVAALAVTLVNCYLLYTIRAKAAAQKAKAD